MSNTNFIVDMHDNFMEFKLNASPFLTDFHPPEVITYCTRLYAYMVENAIRRLDCPFHRDGSLSESTAKINEVMRKHFPYVQKELEEYELPAGYDRVVVDAIIPSRVLIKAYSVSHRDLGEKLIDRIIEDLAEGVSYPRHIRSMIEEEYPNAIESKQRE